MNDKIPKWGVVMVQGWIFKFFEPLPKFGKGEAIRTYLVYGYKLTISSVRITKYPNPQRGKVRGRILTLWTLRKFGTGEARNFKWAHLSRIQPLHWDGWGQALQIWYTDVRLTIASSNQQTRNYPLKGRGQDHVTNFLNVGTPSYFWNGWSYGIPNLVHTD